MVAESTLRDCRTASEASDVTRAWKRSRCKGKGELRHLAKSEERSSSAVAFDVAYIRPREARKHLFRSL